MPLHFIPEGRISGLRKQQFIWNAGCVGAVSARHGYDCTPRQLALLAVLGELGITVLNTGSLYLDSLIYGYYSPVFVFGTLPLRLAICAGKGIVLALLLPTLLRVTRRALQPHAN